MNARLPVVAVLGSAADPCLDRAAQLGAWLAGEPVHLVTGGGGGVMAAVSEAFHSVAGRRGLVLGIVPGVERQGRVGPPPGYPNPWVEILVQTHLPETGARGETPGSRNHLPVLSADVCVFLPGAAGTLSEARLAVRYRRPAIAFLRDRREVIGLPGGLPVTASFAVVRAFVRAHLHRR